MRGAVLYGPRDVRFEECAAPTILKPTDAIIRISATCVCGSDLWPYRGLQPNAEPTPMGHEYCGIVEDVGSAVSNETRPIRDRIVLCVRQHLPALPGGVSDLLPASGVRRAQAPLLRVPLADGTLVPTPAIPSDDLIPSLLALPMSWARGGLLPKPPT